MKTKLALEPVVFTTPEPKQGWGWGGGAAPESGWGWTGHEAL